MDDRKDVIVVTGFLGAGKTTFLNRFLHEYRDKRIGVIVNDFGQVGVDATLIKNRTQDEETHGQEIIEITNGSIFCSCLESVFVDGLAHYADEPIDMLLIETSGLSDPAGMQKIVTEHPDLFLSFNVKAAFCLVDATKIANLLPVLEASRRQIRASNYIIINKLDAFKGDLTALKGTIREINETAHIFEARYAEIDFSAVVADAENPFEILKECCDISLDMRKEISTMMLPQADVTQERLDAFTDAVCEKVLRLKGFISIDGTLYFITDGAEGITRTPFTEGDVDKHGIAVIYYKEHEETIIRKWNECVSPA